MLLTAIILSSCSPGQTESIEKLEEPIRYYNKRGTVEDLQSESIPAHRKRVFFRVGEHIFFPEKSEVMPMRIADGNFPVVSAYINQPLCVEIPTIVLERIRRWGPIFYQNVQNMRVNLSDLLWLSVDLNCPNNVVKAIRVLALNDSYRKEGGPPRIEFEKRKYNYEGYLLPDYGIIHTKADGLNTYYTSGFGGTIERNIQSRNQRRLIAQRGITTTDSYCSRNPLICLGVGALILKSLDNAINGGGIGVAGSQDGAQCINQCLLTTTGLEQSACIANC